ncbi:DUF4435 domain-containing protein [Cupriavidus numazuensis]|uniref:DUF4435 domain-containing protein n=1 Tax=Cupriavidus numazuensis TaxID=221992 RepID=A0ABM8TL29_9BURK|nr:DUF4435 domain-containing protein [Cupriavidus numazuensis]CAG2152866.1 hypothetical protein LMG26411_04286 [Cupriavidus numazuensis]
MEKYEIDEILNLAVMCKMPHLIVEGIDDIKVFEQIAASAGKTCEVYAVENIAEYTPGSAGVKRAMEDLVALSTTPGDIEAHILGIVDRDASHFRSEMPELAPLLILKKYSIESHFVSAEVLKELITKSSSISPSLLEKLDFTALFTRLATALLDIFYPAAEALRTAVTPGYLSTFRYEDGIGRRLQQETKDALEAKKNDLNAFMKSRGLSKDFDSLSLIAKGKWLYEVFCELILDLVRELRESCRSAKIYQCQFCKYDADSKACQYKLADGIGKKALYSLGRELVNNPEFDYIRSRIAAMR